MLRPGLHHRPPGELSPETVPQFVAITFDDGFGLEAGGVGGVDDIVDFCHRSTNPEGSSNPRTFDGSPVRVTFYLTTSNGRDPGNLRAWTRAFQDGHELGNHSVNHPNGGEIASGVDHPQTFDPSAWREEIRGAEDFLASHLDPSATRSPDVVGFRAPFLSYNDAMFATLRELGYLYDTSILGSFAEEEKGSSCSWPYQLDEGSPDAESLHARCGLPPVGPHPGLWEVPVSTLFIPGDDQAERYTFRPGLTGRIGRSMPYPSLSDPEGGKIAGLDYALLVHGGLPPGEMTAILKHTLDLRRQTNRAPLVFAAHTFLYAFSDPISNDNTPTPEARLERWTALVAFMEYALSLPEVRLCTVRDIVGWMRNPEPLSAKVW
jgi:hypothetical protein